MENPSFQSRARNPAGNLGRIDRIIKRLFFGCPCPAFKFIRRYLQVHLGGGESVDATFAFLAPGRLHDAGLEDVSSFLMKP